jgi:magnesium transporter
MSSPPRDGPVLSSSPMSVTESPLRRRESASTSDVDEPTSRRRRSPTLIRTFDPNDPQVRERQRTMDVDMAMQLFKARRETLNLPPPVTSRETAQPSSFPSDLSPNEQHDFDIARGATPLLVDHPAADDADDNTLHLHQHPSRIDLHDHLHQAQDPSLLVSLGVPNQHYADSEDPSSAVFGLPTYQANVSRSNFDFLPMEEFAEEEKAKLGISSGTTKFSLTAFRKRYAGVDTSAAQAEEPPDGPSDLANTFSRPIRHRKLSQSVSSPRLHRKGIGGKMALFEGNTGDPIHSPPGRFGVVWGSQGGPGSVTSFENTATTAPPGTAGISPGMGILTTGHDRPYRFSFYSNALSATIHARSLSELPADGQSFEALFTGITPPSDSATTKDPPTLLTFSPADTPKRPASGAGVGGGTKAQGHNNKFSTPKLGMGDNQRNGMNKGVTGGWDSDATTWWLDVQSPTDEEMKMLSKVNIVCYFGMIYAPDLSLV